MDLTSFPPVVPWLQTLIVPLLVFLIFVLLDLILGSALAWRKGNFDLEKFPQFLKNFLVFLLAWIVSECIAYLAPVVLSLEMSEITDALQLIAPKLVLIPILGKYVSSISKNIKAILKLTNPAPWSPELHTNGQDVD